MNTYLLKIIYIVTVINVFIVAESSNKFYQELLNLELNVMRL